MSFPFQRGWLKVEVNSSWRCFDGRKYETVTDRIFSQELFSCSLEGSSSISTEDVEKLHDDDHFLTNRYEQKRNKKDSSSYLLAKQKQTEYLSKKDTATALPKIDEKKSPKKNDLFQNRTCGIGLSTESGNSQKNENKCKLTDTLTLVVYGVSEQVNSKSLLSHQVTFGQCQTNTDDKESLKLHKKAKKINRSFVKNYDIKSLNSSLGKKRHRCPHCATCFSLTSQLTKHIRIHTSKKLDQSLNCSRPSDRNPISVSHLRTNTTKKPHQCMYCTKTFSAISSLTQHLRVHTGEKPYQCSHCAKRFSVKANLTRHLHTHTEEKPYQCSHCPKRFSLKSKLTHHLRLYTGEKRYQCSHCAKGFYHKPDLTRHLRIHSIEKSHQCSQCDQRFTEISSLIQHIRTHTEEKPYSCTQCAKRFARKSNLVRHLSVHTGEKPYQCSQCAKRFSEKAKLTRHLSTHTIREARYPCSQCDKRFARKSSLVQHLRSHTGQKPH